MDDLFGRKNVNFSVPVEDSKRKEKFRKQRLSRGFDDTELWNLDLTFAKFMLPRLKEFRKKTCSYPSELNNIDEWNKILDEMIEGLQLWTKHFDWDFSSDQNTRNGNHLKVETALNHLAKYFRDLWW